VNCPGLLRVNLIGGFGNQLFQIANAVNLSFTYDLPIYFSTKAESRNKFLKQIFGFEYNTQYIYSDSNLVKVSQQTHSNCKFDFFSEKGTTYCPINLKSRHTEMRGYFQSVQYFEKVKYFMRQKLQNLTSNSNNLGHPGIHIRLGDYLHRSNRNIYHLQSPYYFLHGLDLLRRNIGFTNTKLSVFTNDLKSYNLIYSKHLENYDVELIIENSCTTFKMMLEIKNFVISNSTFSWWAAWANMSNTVAPLKWYTNKSRLEYDEKNFSFENWDRI
jgi:hypothetical protein